MKKTVSLLLTSLLLTGCTGISEDSWVENNSKENEIRAIVQPSSDTNQTNDSPKLEQVKTEFWPTAPKFKMAKFTVTNVLEGDLIEVNGEEKIRLLGISTKTPTRYKRVYFEVQEELAIKYLKETILNKTVYLEQNPQFPRNPNGESVAYVWIGNADKLKNVNAMLLENGYAISERVENVTVYDDSFKRIENTANKNKVGIWNNNK